MSSGPSHPITSRLSSWTDESCSITTMISSVLDQDWNDGARGASPKEGDDPDRRRAVPRAEPEDDCVDCYACELAILQGPSCFCSALPELISIPSVLSRGVYLTQDR